MIERRRNKNSVKKRKGTDKLNEHQPEYPSSPDMLEIDREITNTTRATVNHKRKSNNAKGRSQRHRMEYDWPSHRLKIKWGDNERLCSNTDLQYRVTDLILTMVS